MKVSRFVLIFAARISTETVIVVAWKSLAFHWKRCETHVAAQHAEHNAITRILS